MDIPLNHKTIYLVGEIIKLTTRIENFKQKCSETKAGQSGFNEEESWLANFNDPPYI